MNPQSDDMRNKLFPTYGKKEAPVPTPPAPAAPTPAPAASAPVPPPPPPTKAPAQPAQPLGDTFTKAPLSMEDDTLKEFWKMVGLAFLLYIASIAVTMVHIDGKLGAFIFLLCNPLSYFVIALVASIVLGKKHESAGNAVHATSSYVFMKAHLAVSVFFAIVASILALFLF